jgi:UDP-3-O-[3-hydroxymyristoyl] glucosamine N-acyltransferase
MSYSTTITALAEALDATFEGDGACVVNRVAHPAQGADEGSIVLATDPALIPAAAAAGFATAIVAKGAPVPEGSFRAVIFVTRPRYAMAKLTGLFDEIVTVPKGVHPSAVIEPSARLGKDVAVGPFVYVGENAVIGDGCVLHPQVYVAPNATLGANTVLHAGVKIGAGVTLGARCMVHFNSAVGSDGFSYVTPEPGSVETAKAGGAVTATNQTLCRIASLGGIVIGDDVEIGSNTSIDRGTIAPTRIGNGTKIDNQVQIGHNVQVGENVMLCGRVGIAGSAEIGDRVVLGGATGVADHVKIGADALAMGMSGIAGNVPPKSIVGGAPAKPRQRMIEEQFQINRLKHLAAKVDALLQRVDALEADAKKA